MRAVFFVGLVFAIAACGKESSERLGPFASALPASALPASAPPASALLASALPASALPASPREVARRVDLIEGADAAIATFRQWLVASCKRLRASTARTHELAAMGLPDADVDTLCVAPDREGRGIASVGRDVVVEGPSGGDGASGARALFRVTPRGEVKTLTTGPGFEGIARVALPGHDDAVMLCTKNGRQGLYYGDCGFLGEGTFQRTPTPSKNELHRVFTTTCGDGDAVHVRAPSLFGDRLEVPVEVEKVHLARAAGDEGDFCSQRRRVAYERFTIRYRLERGRFERVTDVPKEVERVLARY